MTRPTKDMTKTAISREQLLALLQGDDAMRALVQTIVQEVLEAEMDEALGATKGERTGERRGYRSGYYGRKLTTRVGTLELRVPPNGGSARVRRGPSISRSMIGSVNAAVLPVPVWARPMRSRPRRASGIASRWIGVGVVYPASRIAARTLSWRPRASKPTVSSVAPAVGSGASCCFDLGMRAA